LLQWLDSVKHLSVNQSPFTKKCSSLARWVPLLVVTLLTACKREEIKVYYAPKDNSGSPEMAAPDSGNTMGTLPPGMATATPGIPQLTYKTPDGWTEVAPSEMRVASFTVKSADGNKLDVSVVPLPGPAGGDASNVNRWRSQVGLTAMSEAELAKAAEQVDVGGQPGALYEQMGTNPGSGEPMGIIAAIQHRDDISWFYKITGDPTLLAQQKPVFLEFLKSVGFTAAPAGLPEGHPAIGGDMLPVAHPDVAMTPATTSGPISHDGQPTWQVPAGWQEVSGGQFLIAKFMITDESGSQAAVNVSASPGDGGGLAANVTRWRGQLSLAPFTPDELASAVYTIEVAGGQGSLVEMSGTDARAGKPAALAGIIVTQGGKTWFYKLMGDPKTVEAQKDTFLKFVQTVKY